MSEPSMAPIPRGSIGRSRFTMLTPLVLILGLYGVSFSLPVGIYPPRPDAVADTGMAVFLDSLTVPLYMTSGYIIGLNHYQLMYPGVGWRSLAGYNPVMSSPVSWFALAGIFAAWLANPAFWFGVYCLIRKRWGRAGLWAATGLVLAVIGPWCGSGLKNQEVELVFPWLAIGYYVWLASLVVLAGVGLGAWARPSLSR